MERKHKFTLTAFDRLEDRVVLSTNRGLAGSQAWRGPRLGGVRGLAGSGLAGSRLGGVTGLAGSDRVSS